MPLRPNLHQARTPAEKRAILRVTFQMVFGAMAVLGAAFRWSDSRGGGFSIARFEATGPFAWAEHANGLVAVASSVSSPALVLGVVSVIALVPVLHYARVHRSPWSPSPERVAQDLRELM